MRDRKRWIPVVLFVLYCLFIIWYTLFNRSASVTRKVDLRLLWSYREWLAGSPNGEKDVLQNLSKIAFFIPFGLLIPAKNWKPVLIAAGSFSILIEGTQYVFSLGLCELDDVICNTLGAMVGFWLWNGLMRVKRNMDET